MSLIIALNVPTGIVLSGDSRMTGTLTQQIPNPTNPDTQITVQTNIVLSDAAEKLFILHGRFGVGAYGDMLVNNMPIAHHIEQFEHQTRSNPPLTTQQFANDLLSYFRALQPVPNAYFIVVGYDDTDQWVFAIEVVKGAMLRTNVNPQTQQPWFSIRWGGDSDIVARLYGQAMFAFNAMNLQDAADFTRHLIRSTIDQMRFEVRFPSVGGYIETIVVTPTEARFLARKELTSR